jgi:hypothetical protein
MARAHNIRQTSKTWRRCAAGARRASKKLGAFFFMQGQRQLRNIWRTDRAPVRLAVRTPLAPVFAL